VGFVCLAMENARINSYGELVLEDTSSWSNKIITVNPFNFGDTMEISIDDITEDYHYFNLTREQVEELITFLQEQVKQSNNKAMTTTESIIYLVILVDTTEDGCNSIQAAFNTIEKANNYKQILEKENEHILAFQVHQFYFEVEELLVS
jgi:hypothetical protein